MSLNQVLEKIKKTKWCDKNIEILLEVCMKEVNTRNKLHNHFTKIGWTNIVKNFNKATNLTYKIGEIL